MEQATPQELENLATLYRDTPLSAALLLRLARLAQEAGRPEEAQKWAGTLKERFPESPEAAAGDRLPSGRQGAGGLSAAFQRGIRQFRPAMSKQGHGAGGPGGARWN